MENFFFNYMLILNPSFKTNIKKTIGAIGFLYSVIQKKTN